MSQVKMYKGKDFRDGEMSMMAVRGEMIAVSSRWRDTDPWDTPEGFGNFDSWGADQIEPIDAQSISEAELIWTA